MLRRARCDMMRTLGVILLSLCVLAMPSYAAITCGSACGTTKTSADQHACCPGVAANAQPASSHDDGAPASPGHSDTGGKQHCAAPCCGYVATVTVTGAAQVDAQPLADLLPTAAILAGSVDHDAIFHPPRL
jgi:hypothetical protein